MADKTDEIEVVLEDEKPATETDLTPEVKAEEIPGSEKKELTPEEGLEALKASLEREKADRAAADQRAAEAAQRERKALEEAGRAGTDAMESQLQMLETALGQNKQTAEMLEGQYAEALTNQDYAAAAKIQRQMVQVEQQLMVLETGHRTLEERKKNPPPVERPTDPVEGYIAAINPGQESANWLRKNPDFVTDPRKNRQMVRAHEDAVDDGIAINSPQYFDYVEKKLGLRSDESRREETYRERDAAPAAAPVSRDVGGSVKNPRRITLTAEEREIAQLSGMTDLEYAQQKARMN